ncbi:hypothetical protein [Spiroplasma turonicum]|uniref:Transmembrane protein n=1 Tax=Spiroplasma turonicum TaxID=216946 RepID=A0A0K1P697_9MOLU|nr:hypothetical protein [Spiroplasma turonicum]AKU79417.1 hypothetical protein STURON_00171 [Spiroplasma turonicum]ALX70438.1 hypothetical protein STURO_v1c01690 [Spiroplasma turonicum]
MSSIRTWLIIANIFGVISATFGIVVLIYIAQLFLRQGLSSSDLAMLTENIKPEYIPVLFSVMAFLACGNLYYCCYIINFVRKSDDDTLINNRWILAVFSLSVGGLFTPFVLAQMPNVEVKSSSDPKFTISKAYGVNALLAPIVGVSFYFIFLKGTGLSMGMSQTNQIVWIVFAVIGFWGILNCALFAGPNAKNVWDKKGAGYKFMNLIAVINLVYATIILIIQIILSILTIISIIADLFNPKNKGIFGFFDALLAPLKIAMQLFIIYTIVKTIKGLWSKGNSFQYGVYTNLSEKQKNYEMNR